jgi:hypothetical protein
MLRLITTMPVNWTFRRHVIRENAMSRLKLTVGLLLTLSVTASVAYSDAGDATIGAKPANVDAKGDFRFHPFCDS